MQNRGHYGLGPESLRVSPGASRRSNTANCAARLLFSSATSFNRTLFRFLLQISTGSFRVFTGVRFAKVRYEASQTVLALHGMKSPLPLLVSQLLPFGTHLIPNSRRQHTGNVTLPLRDRVRNWTRSEVDTV